MVQLRFPACKIAWHKAHTLMYTTSSTMPTIPTRHFATNGLKPNTQGCSVRCLTSLGPLWFMPRPAAHHCTVIVASVRAYIGKRSHKGYRRKSSRIPDRHSHSHSPTSFFRMSHIHTLRQ
mmetsp:Transcript_23065/g.70646  ORF Transcript_23065/g.70646 Transcript_23065/m.70646 type:complete len:120 (+) Transcript_23065:51-410(+)